MENRDSGYSKITGQGNAETVGFFSSWRIHE